MNYSKLFFICLIFLASLVTSCKKENKSTTKTPNIDVKILTDKAIRKGELKIYPIINLSSAQNNDHLIFAEALKNRGFNIRRSIQGQGIYTIGQLNRNTLNFANKSNVSSLLLFGDIAQASNEIFIAQESREIPAKKITEINFISINRTGYNQTEGISLKPLFPCPPTPLRNLLHNKPQLTINWLQEALPLLGFPIQNELKTHEMDLNLFEKNKIEEQSDRIPQEHLGELEDFLQRFSPIAQDNQAIGCLVTYQDTILISYIFAQANLFKKEWPYISTSIYLNQLMGYRPTEMQSFRPFVNTETSASHIQTLWKKNRVLAKDDAYRGEWDGVPFYLVWF